MTRMLRTRGMVLKTVGSMALLAGVFSLGAATGSGERVELQKAASAKLYSCAAEEVALAAASVDLEIAQSVHDEALYNLTNCQSDAPLTATIEPIPAPLNRN